MISSVSFLSFFHFSLLGLGILYRRDSDMSQAIPSTPAYLDTVTKRALSRFSMNIDCVRSVIVELD